MKIIELRNQPREKLSWMDKIVEVLKEDGKCARGLSVKLNKDSGWLQFYLRTLIREGVIEIGECDSCGSGHVYKLK